MIDESTTFFPDVKPSADPPRKPFAPPPRPNFTIQEEFLETVRRVNETLNRVLCMEESFKLMWDDFKKSLTADNVSFKDLCMTAYNQFTQTVRTEVNSFESDITNAFNAFADSVRQDISNYVAAYDVFRSEIDRRITDFETAQTEALNAYKVELNDILNSFRDTTDARIEQYNANHEAAFTNYVTQMNANFAAAQATLEASHAEYTQATDATIAEFRDMVERRLDGQNETIADAVHYMKLNLLATVDGIVDEMAESGELALSMGKHMSMVTPKMYGAKGDGETDDSEAIQTMIDEANQGDTVYFDSTVYAVSIPIIVNKKLNICGRGATLLATNDMPYVIWFNNQGSLSHATVSDLKVDAGDKAFTGFEIGGGNGSHTTQITFARCCATNAKYHGFHVRPVAYCLTFDRCCAMYNDMCGYHAVATGGDAQVNAIYFNGCTSQLNQTDGFMVNGVNIVLNGCNSERNSIYGVMVGGQDYPCYGVEIRGGYYENNDSAQICIDGESFVCATIEGNYFYSAIPDETGQITHVKCRGQSDTVRLHYDMNTTSGENRIDVDGGNVVNRDSYINAQYTANTKLAKLGHVPMTGYRHYLPVAMSGGTPCVSGNPAKSVNMVDDTVKKVSIIVPCNLVNRVIRTIGCKVDTNGTSGKLRISVSVKNANGDQVKGTCFDFDLTESKVCEGNALNNMGYYNIPNDGLVVISYILAEAGDATDVSVSQPYIDVYG